MILKKHIPKDFYRLFRTKNMDAYMEFLVAIYEENNEVYAALGLTREECAAVILEIMAKKQLVWKDEETDQQEKDAEASGDSPSLILNHLIDWGWLNSDYDEKMDSYIISFPEYSQLFVELFKKLQSEDSSQERESILAVYSALYTFQADPEKNNGILQNALKTSRRLGQLLSNMQDGMRGYFDKLSGRKNFIGIQEVLVEEINNSDSRKYAILTTTDSFYRYKEAVKELISQILSGNDMKKHELETKLWELQKGDGAADGSASRGQIRIERALAVCNETAALVYQVEREFDQIERKYNKLIEQKTVFAKRALARVRYILQEGTNDGDQLVRLMNLLDRSKEKEKILEELRDRMQFGTSFALMTDSSFYNRREKGDRVFQPVAPQVLSAEDGRDIADFVPKPLYTKKQIREFREKNTHGGRFTATAETVQSVEDLEKLLFLWQQETEIRAESDRIVLGDEIETEEGFRFSGFTIEEDAHA